MQDCRLKHFDILRQLHGIIHCCNNMCKIRNPGLFPVLASMCPCRICIRFVELCVHPQDKWKKGWFLIHPFIAITAHKLSLRIILMSSVTRAATAANLLFFFIVQDTVHCPAIKVSLAVRNYNMFIFVHCSILFCKFDNPSFSFAAITCLVVPIFHTAGKRHALFCLHLIYNILHHLFYLAIVASDAGILVNCPEFSDVIADCPVERQL